MRRELLTSSLYSFLWCHSLSRLKEVIKLLFNNTPNSIWFSVWRVNMRCVFVLILSFCVVKWTKKLEWFVSNLKSKLLSFILFWLIFVSASSWIKTLSFLTINCIRVGMYFPPLIQLLTLGSRLEQIFGVKL